VLGDDFGSDLGHGAPLAFSGGKRQCRDPIIQFFTRRHEEVGQPAKPSSRLGLTTKGDVRVENGFVV
jgi:hypothetical protein